MNFDTKQGTKRKRIRIPKESRSYTSNMQLEIAAGSLQHLFQNGLKRMAHLLKSRFCESITHSDCVMKVEIEAADCKNLLVGFLTEILALSSMHKAIFCSMNIEEMSEKKLVATLFGTWFDSLDNKPERVIEHKSKVTQNEDLSYKGYVVFEL